MKNLRKIEQTWMSYNPKTDKEEDFGVIITIEPTDFRKNTQELAEFVADYIVGMIEEDYPQELRLRFKDQRNVLMR
jgi:hypothetical protein